MNHYLVLDPALKLEYLEAAWDQEFIKMGMVRMKKKVSNWISYVIWRRDIESIFQFLVYKAQYEASQQKSVVTGSSDLKRTSMFQTYVYITGVLTI